jgi:hypothetical protein
MYKMITFRVNQEVYQEKLWLEELGNLVWKFG